MSMLEEIRTRQSIRKFKDQPIEPEKITALLQAAMRAPSAANRQEWRFLVISDRESLDAITTLSPYTKMMSQAQAAIVVSGDHQVMEQDGYIYVDCAAAIENILLEAKHLDLGTCWCGIGPNEERINAFKNYFNLPASYLPVGVIAIGYSNENKPLVDRYDENKITYWKK